MPADYDDLLKDYVANRKRTEDLVIPLSAEDCMLQCVEEASPTKWHLGHTTWLFERFVLNEYSSHYSPFNDNHYFIFNSYYKGAGDHLLRRRRGNLSRPTLSEIFEYRGIIDERIAALLSLHLKKSDYPEIAQRIRLGIEHEKQHQELLLTDIKRNFFENPLYPPYRERSPLAQSIPPLTFHSVKEGLYEIGHSRDGFTYDNEGPMHKHYLNGYAVANRLISNGEYMNFILDRGYERPSLWLSDGWDVIQGEAWRVPLYWIQKGSDWYEFQLSGLEPLDPNQPVTHISFYEADAFARWAGFRLATEFEWEIAAAHSWNDRPGNFMDEGSYTPRYAESDTPQQFLGSAWEWTSSGYLPYPGYQAPPGAIGEYNGKFMNDQRVLRGGSCVTPPDHIRLTYRNFFQSEKRWQFTGIRLARDVR